MKILHLIDSLDDNDGARQLRRIAPAFTAGAGVEVCCLGGDSSACAELRRRGIPTHALGWTRWFDPGALLHLRDLVREAAPEVIHVWHLTALRAFAVVASDRLPRVVMNAPLEARGRLAWWDRLLLDRIGCLAFADVQEQARWVGQQIVRPSQRVVAAAADDDLSPSAAMENGSCRIACVGPVERDTGIRQAIWALDILLLAHPNLELDVVGDGSQRALLQALSVGLYNNGQVHWHSPADTERVLASADIVWVPSLTNMGRQAALDAMSLGKPVVASDVSCLRELIRDGEIGMLATPGDVVALARRTHVLLQDPALRTRLGQTARQEVRRRFALADAVHGWRQAYSKVA